MRIGIFGGTFDPPHVGHLILAEECQTQLSLDRLLWVVTDNPPHKCYVSVSPIEARVALVDKAIQGSPAFQLSRVDIDRPGPHFAIDTVNILKTEYPGAEMFYLMGGDSLHDLPTWNKPLNFIRICDGIGVMRRHADHVDLESLEKVLPGISMKVRIIEAPILEISSKQIRQRIAEGMGYRYYLRDAVYEAIRELGMYR
ncbi:MAG: nicotinate-nucleotide adenylyltransferase [Chloroflexi bacterium]|nr:MAG: nicotinate-nucleotide adenylyltransferase [Chloroflexota bacterium]MBA4375910.1 nicotinate (nicotinamide) nucleotide adenylyltransferase [Anaerolinea sp.]